MSDNSGSSGGSVVIGLIGVLFVALKLLGITEVATWSWWWVTLPFWGGVVFVLVACFALVLFLTIRK